MKSDSQIDYPAGDYAPHVLSGSEARRQSGRRTPGLNRTSGSFPWYTTYMIDQGPFAIYPPDAKRMDLEGPAVISLPPLPSTKVHIPSSTLYSWLEWGAVRLPLCPRDTVNASRKYPKGLVQPQPEEIWGLPLPLQLPPRSHQATAGMMVRVNASWWRGGAHRMLANAELSLWIARHLFPPGDRREEAALPDLFPGVGEDFMEAVRTLEQSLAMSVDVRDWALALDTSTRSLQRWCRKETGLSPQGVLDRVRLRRAEQLLQAGKMTLGDICRHCGFSSPASFSAWFSAKKGAPPGRWRKHGG